MVSEAPIADLINIDLALEWLSKQDPKRSCGKQKSQFKGISAEQNHDDLVFGLLKAKCVQLLQKAIQIWKNILDQEPSKK